MKMLYKYPQQEYPYQDLLNVSNDRKSDMTKDEYELLDTGIFKDNKYWDIFYRVCKSR